MGERLLCKQEVVGSIPSSSTSFRGQVTGIRHQKYGGIKRKLLCSGLRLAFLARSNIGCSLTIRKVRRS